MRLGGKVALITGAGAGIGRATALLFAREGASVAVVDLNEHTARETAETIRNDGGQAIAIAADVSDPADIERMFQATVEAYGKLNILFNNAGIVKQGRVEDSTIEDWNAQIAT